MNRGKIVDPFFLFLFPSKNLSISTGEKNFGEYFRLVDLILEVFPYIFFFLAHLIPHVENEDRYTRPNERK